MDVPFETVKDYFQTIFLGNGSDGLILREQWVARPGMLEKLGRAISTSPSSPGVREAKPQLTLDRFASGVDLRSRDRHGRRGESQAASRRPAAHPEAGPGRTVYYVGDTVDDARCARAAKVPFIGIAAPSNPRYIDLVFLFQEEGAYAIVDDINYLEEVFAA